ncbi:MAG: hypothetical protein BWZ04_01050 [Firmicutes bacterium ADurb.BinA205]|nr:MAG: hypothetical protein BWZ04_01050 [Firmicutes bacterium ADurb.BinA205]
MEGAPDGSNPYSCNDFRSQNAEYMNIRHGLHRIL